MRCFKSIASLAVTLFLTLPLFAQVKINGLVLDKSDPLIGAVISVKGSLTRKLSDYDGQFTLNVSPNTTIEVSYKRYKKVTAIIPENASGTLEVVFRMDKHKATISQAKDEPVTQAQPQVQTQPQPKVQTQAQAQPQPQTQVQAQPQQQDSRVRTKRTYEATGFTWTEVKDGELLGAEVNGKTVVPCRYGYISYSPGYFGATIYGNSITEACYTEDGICIIPESRGYNFVNCYSVSYEGYIKVTTDGKSGLCDKNGKEVLSPSLGYDDISFEFRQPDFCFVKRDGKLGAYSLRSKKEIIPTSFGYTRISLSSMEGNSVDVYRDDEVGRFDIGQQKEIIPVGRYESIMAYEKDGSLVYFVKKGGMAGACNRDGREVVPPQYKELTFGNGKFYYRTSDGSFSELDINGNKINSKSNSSTSTYSSSTGSASTSSSSSSSYSSSSSQSSQKGRLLFGGTYTSNGKTIMDSQIYYSNLVFSCDLQVYEKVVVYNQKEYFYYVGNQVLFEMNYRKYADSNDQFIFVHESGGVAFYATSITQYIPFIGNVTSMSYVMYEKGEMRAQQPVGGGYVPQTGGNTGGANNGRTVCPVCNGSKICTNPGSAHNYKEYCQGSRKCANCGGSGHVPAGYGQSGYVQCVYCNGRLNSSYGDGVCGKCHGTGLCHRCNGRGYL